MYEHGRKCWFCGAYGLSRLSDKRVWCSKCRTKYSLKKLRTDLDVLYYFYLEVSARKCARELGLDYETVSKRYAVFRQAIMLHTSAEFKKLIAAVLTIDPDNHPQFRLVNTVARRRAVWLESRAYDLFLEFEPRKENEK